MISRKWVAVDVDPYKSAGNVDEIFAVNHAEGMGEDDFRRPFCGKCGLVFDFSVFVFVGGDVSPP